MNRFIVGDVHNFGSAVYKAKIDGVTYYHKPRTTFWASLFFGIDSPYKAFLVNTPLEKLFSLTEITQDRVVFQKSVDVESMAPASPYDFGYLVGYCVGLVIQDLHHQNLIHSKNGLQPVDVEIAFSDLISPSQKLLMPGVNISYERSGLSKMFKSMTDVTMEHSIALISGFAESIYHICKYRDEILKQTPSASILSEHNIRVIFRQTQQYLNKSQSFISEENEQLDRGDIPYFFKRHNTMPVYYYKNRSTIEIIKNLPEKFRNIANTVAQEPSYILSKKRLNEKILSLGTLNLAATLKPKLPNGYEFELPFG